MKKQRLGGIGEKKEGGREEEKERGREREEEKKDIPHGSQTLKYLLFGPF